MATDKWQNHIDRMIQEARDRGEFEVPHLKGRKLREDPGETLAGDQAMANKVLKNSGHLPPFLMKKQEIDQMLEAERERLYRYARRRNRLLEAARGAATPEHAGALREQAEVDWQWAIRQFEKALPEINRQIDLFNLMNKIPKMHMLKIDRDRFVSRILDTAAEAEPADESAPPDLVHLPASDNESETEDERSRTPSPALFWWLFVLGLLLLLVIVLALPMLT